MKLTKIEFGDYQTPIDFCRKVIKLIVEKYDVNPDLIIEPTMGIGNFLIAASESFPNCQMCGIEINKDYIEKFNKNNVNAHIYNSNIFNFNFENIKKIAYKCKKILFLGNPPWVTNSYLSSIGSFNIPYKENFKKSNGFDAITGKGNFDICEYILLKILSEFSSYNESFFCFLCKETVVKNIMLELPKYNFNFKFADVYSFNSSEVFGVSCDAVLFIAQISTQEKVYQCGVYDIENPYNRLKYFGYSGNTFISDIENYSSEIDGLSQIQWRQGVKHDCSKVMELKLKDDCWENGYGEKIDFINSEFVYPLIKSSGFKQKIIRNSNIKVIITQMFVRENTDKLKEDKKIWEYLNQHINDFIKRKSSIYKNTPQFSIFGIGEYSFAKYKIGISGFYKNPQFSYLSGEKPFMVDDTSYFIGTNNLEESYILMAVLDNEYTYKFLKSISFSNSKRPFTKDVLQRLDIVKMINKYGYDYIYCYIKSIFLYDISIESIKIFKDKLENHK